MRGAVEKSSVYAKSAGHKSAHRLGCEQILAWKHRRARLQRCKGCGRLIDGEMKRGFCVWCRAMTEAARIEFEAAERKAREERRAKDRARDRARAAERRAVKRAAKEVA